ncbi:hypothetical protein, partial [Pseudomonas yamanorum]|uniref:hypothetical protein n=1 Tax=Pseudomonas yamanorum TaxID=515393 RepID=UPI003B9F56BF
MHRQLDAERPRWHSHAERGNDHLEPTKSCVGAVELQRGCEEVLSGNKYVACQSAIAASLKLDKKHS